MEIEDMSDIIADERPTSELASAIPLTTSSASAPPGIKPVAAFIANATPKAAENVPVAPFT